METEFEKAMRDHADGKPLRVAPVLQAIRDGVQDWKPGRAFPGGKTLRDVLNWMSDPKNKDKLDYS
jgi:hypothetical protein